jgi:hypothetical protein
MKKGSIFILLLTVLFIFAMLPLLYFAVHTKTGKFERNIGEKQATLLQTYEKGEIPLFYIDEAAKLAFREAVYEVYHDGGAGGGCGSYDGYVLLNDRTRSCYPDIKSRLKSGMLESLYGYLEKFPEKIPSIPYSIYLLDSGSGSIVEAKALKSLRMEIGSEPYNFVAEELQFTVPETPEDEEDDDDDEPPADIGDDDDFESDPPDDGPSEGKCGYIVDYAKQYLDCPYLLNCGYANYVACQYFPPNMCRPIGLTCATFVGSVYYFKEGVHLWGHGATKCSSNPEKVTMLGTDVERLQPGDVFQAGHPIGHTGMYVGKGTLSGEVSYFGTRTCYEHFAPSSSGKHVFIHSIGNSDGGPPGVCYEFYEDLFAPGRNQVTQFCRVKLCE